MHHFTFQVFFSYIYSWMVTLGTTGFSFPHLFCSFHMRLKCKTAKSSIIIVLFSCLSLSNGILTAAT